MGMAGPCRISQSAAEARAQCPPVPSSGDPRAEGPGRLIGASAWGTFPGRGAEGQIGERGKEPAAASAPQGLTVRHDQVEGLAESVALDLEVPVVPGACQVAGRVAAAVPGADRSFALQRLQSGG